MQSSPTGTPKAATRRPTATRYVSPTGTAWPTPRPSSTPGAPQPLSDLGLYLAFTKATEDGLSLVFMDVDGSGGRISVPLPPANTQPRPYGMRNFNPIDGLSPDGRHFAYYTGTIAESDEDPAPNDLTLEIMDVEGGRVEKSIRLLSPEFPSDVRRAAEEMAENPPEGLEDASASDFYASLRWALESGIFASEWSPDSRLLAFVGEMDGPSSDVYTYDVVSKRTARLTDGPGEVQYLQWSPDGQWIMHGSAFWTGVGNYMDSYVVSRDGSVTKSFGRVGQFQAGFSGSSWFLVYESANGIGSYGIKALDLEQGGIVSLWPYPFGDFALNRQLGLLLVNNPMKLTDVQPEPPGVYLVDVESNAMRLLPLPMPSGLWDPWKLFGWGVGEGTYPFLATDPVAGTFAVSHDGSIRQLAEGGCEVELSPDKAYLAFYDRGEGSCGGLRIFDKAGDFVRTLTEEPVERVMWAPDSDSLIYFSGGGLLVSRLDGTPPIVLMQPIEEGVDVSSFTWVRR